MCNTKYAILFQFGGSRTINFDVKTIWIKNSKTFYTFIYVSFYYRSNIVRYIL